MGAVEYMVRMLKELLMSLWGSHVERSWRSWEAHDVLEKANARSLFEKGKKDFPGLFHKLFSFTSNGHSLPEHPCVHAGALWPRWLDYFMAGKISKGSSHQDHQGPCEKRLRELEKGHVEGHLTAAHCYLQGGCQWYQMDRYLVVCSLHWYKAEQQQTAGPDWNKEV